MRSRDYNEKDYLINKQENGAFTHLHCPCVSGASDIVKIWMFMEADETITNFNWETPA